MLTRPENVILIGNYGAGNLGDDLLCRQAILGIKSQYPDCSIVVLAADPQAIKFCDDLVFGRGTIFPSGPRSFLKGLFSGDLFANMRMVARAELLVFGGGGLLNREEILSLWIWGLNILGFDWLRKRKSLLIMLGQSFNLPKRGLIRQICRNLLNRFDIITVREQLSYKELKLLKFSRAIVRETADLAFGFEPEKLVFNSGDDQYAVLSLREYRGIDHDQLKRIIMATVNYLVIDLGLRIEFLPMEAPDLDFAQILTADFPERIKNAISFRSVDSLTELSSLIAGCRLVVAMRLHAGILGLLGNKPVFYLSYSSKVIGVMKAAGAEFGICLRSEARIPEAEIVSRLANAIENIQPSKSPVELRKLADKNFELISFS
jgi:polysaccharide pyruvyl transferase WcaK-like protein